jgi:hypothetical protein
MASSQDSILGPSRVDSREQSMDSVIHTPQMSVDAFKKLVREGVEDACKNQGWNNTKENERGYAFQKWVGELILGVKVWMPMSMTACFYLGI